MQYWLVKSEPGVFSIDDLKSSPGRTTCWEGVRNYQARNFMRDGMKRGDPVFFYHSNCPEAGIAGIATVVKEAYPDATAFDPADKHYDPKSDPDHPRWYMVDLKYKRKFKRVIPLAELRRYANGALEGLILLRRGNRLSVLPVQKKHWDFIVQLE
jgi:predicted RNA-binding protein with PUA-like domain